MRGRVQTVPADVWERRAALDPTRSFIVQAPAGSGKTELLIQRYLALLARVSAPESVLAITFTVKASGEMRERIAAALEAALSGADTPDANSRLTRELAAAVLDRDREAGWEILANPSRLRIHTIDALCAGIAQRMPWLVRFGAMPRVTEQAAEMYAEAARATLRLVGGGNEWAEPAERVLSHLDNDFARARRMLEALLPRRDQWLRHVVGPHRDPGAIRESMQATLAAVCDRALARLRNAVPPLWRGEMWDLAGFAAANLGRSAADDWSGWRFLRGLLLKTDGDWREKPDHRNGFPASEKAWKQRHARLVLQLRGSEDFRQRLEEFASVPSPSFDDNQWEVLEALLRLLPAAAAQLRLVFQEHGTVDFSEIAQAASRGLGEIGGPSDLAFHIGGRFEHILVDEMQDTSITQVELLSKLTASWDESDGNTLLLVGDPMQSIYRFREAEVGLFLRVRERGLGQLHPEPLALSANFRSRPEIVEWVNGAFALLFPAEEDALLGAVRFHPSTAFRPAGGEGAVQVHAFFGADPRPEAMRAAGLAAEASKKGSVAILVRARTHVPAIVAELQRLGVSYRAVEQDLLGERPAVRDLLALTRALLHLADRPAWLAILRAPWCGLGLADLHAIAGGDSRAAVWDLLRRDDLRVTGAERLARFRSAMEGGLARVRRMPLRDCVERTWRALGGPASLEDTAAEGDAARFLGLIEEMDRGGEIADFQALDERVSELYADPDPAADESLQIMTIHKAKGLQFDTVIVPCLGREAQRDDKQLLLWAELPREDDGADLVISPMEAAEDESDPIYEWLRDLERRRGEHEAARLLYVAATRAKEKLHLIGQVEVKDDEIRRPRAGSLLRLLWPVVRDDFQRAFEGGEPVTEKPAIAREGLSLRRLPASWDGGAEAGAPVWTPAEEPEPVAFAWVGDTLRHAGTAVHAWLRRVAEDGVEKWDGARIAAAHPAIEAGLLALGVPPREVRDAARTVSDAVVRALCDERGRWILRRRPADACEYAVAVELDGAIHHAVVDRTFVEDGVRWIVDYKTSSHQGAGLEDFLEKERSRYKDQLQRYARLFRRFENLPVRLGLYFPLLGEWREWEDEAYVFTLTPPE